MESRKIPFTSSYPTVLNELIVSYLPPANVENLHEEKKEDQAYLHDAARKYLQKKQSQKDLLENLVALLPKIAGDKFNDEDYFDESKDNYKNLCAEYKDILISYINNLFSISTSLTSEQSILANDCIMHYCHNFPFAAGKLLYQKVPSQHDKDWSLVELLIEHGAKVNTGAYFTLNKAIINNVRTDIIRKLIQYLDTPPSISNKKPYSTYDCCPLLLAGLFSSLDVVNDLIKKFPNLANNAIQALNSFLSDVNYFGYRSIYENTMRNDRKDYNLSQSQIKHAIAKLVISSTKNTEYLITEESKKFALEYIDSILTNSTSLADCLTFYNNHINSVFVNRSDNLASSVFKFFYNWSAQQYASTKKEFIEVIQKNICKIFTSDKFKKSFNSQADIYKACENILMHPVFSFDHIQLGVDKAYRDIIKEIKFENTGKWCLDSMALA